MVVAALPPAPAVVEFYAPWCGACQRFAPEFAAAAAALDAAAIGVATVNCDADIMCDAAGIDAYPTVVAIDVNAGAVPYRGELTAAAVVKWAAGVFGAELAPPAAVAAATTPPPAASRGHHVATADDAIAGLIASVHGLPTTVGPGIADAVRTVAAALSVPTAMMGTGGQPLTRAMAVATMAAAEKTVAPSVFCNASLPCTVWAMIHTVAGTAGGATALPAAAAVVVATFKCVECVTHFTAMVNGDVAGVPPLAAVECDSAAVRWAWRAHNAVNARRNVRPFPTVTECASCVGDDDVLAYLGAVYGTAGPPSGGGEASASLAGAAVGGAVAGAAAALLAMVVVRWRQAPPPSAAVTTPLVEITDTADGSEEEA